MSGEHTKKEMETGDKPATSHGKASSEESRNKKKGKEKKASSRKSHRSGDKIKKMRKVVYYETDTSSPSTSGSVASEWRQDKEDEEGGYYGEGEASPASPARSAACPAAELMRRGKRLAGRPLRVREPFEERITSALSSRRERGFSCCPRMGRELG
jgi:hypothetical protein